MKKFLSIILILVMCLSACGTKSEQSVESSAHTESENTQVLTEEVSESEIVSETETVSESEMLSTSENSTEIESSVTNEPEKETMDTSQNEVLSETENKEEIIESESEEQSEQKEEEIIYTYTNVEKTMWVKSNANVRDLPCSEGKKLGKLKTGDKIKVTGKCNESKWYRIEFKKDVGYVSEKYLTDTKPTIDYTYTLYKDHMDIWRYSVCKSSANVYDEPSSSGKVIDKFGYKHLMMVVGKCNETGWYKIIYDDKICAESNYQEHGKVLYDYDSMYPAAQPGGAFISFSREVKNVKEGYINPKDVIVVDAWEDEVIHNWNGVEFGEPYGMTKETLNYYKRLCYADRFTIIERDNRAGMLVPDPDAIGEGTDEGIWCLLYEYANELGYQPIDGCGHWLDMSAEAYYIEIEFLRPEEQTVEMHYSGGGCSYLFNGTYTENKYGYSEDEVLRMCRRYVTSSTCDRSIGIWDDEKQAVTFNLNEMIRICQIMENQVE